MASITSSGLGSGLDVNGIIKQLMELESQPLTKLQARAKEAETKISAVGSLQSALSTFQARVLGLSSVSAYKTLKGSLGDSAIGTVSTASNAQAGSYSLAVTQLAQSHKLKSQVFTGVNEPVGTGKLTIQFGTHNDNGTTANTADDTFEVNGDKGALTLDIDSSNNTLVGLRDAINAKKAGVSATIVNDGSGYRLLLSSTDSGKANSLRITVEDDDYNAGTNPGGNTDTSGLSRFVYDPAGARNMAQTQAAQNAEFQLDGIAISKASNTVTDVLQGVTLNLQKISALDSNSAPITTTLSVARDTSGVKTAVEEFVKSYNEFAKVVDGLSYFDKETKTSGLLNGDYVIRSMQSTIRSTLNQGLGAGSYYQSLGAVGVTYNDKGQMTLDASKLQKALNERPDDVASLFAVNGVASDSRVSYVSSTAATQTGNYAINITAAATRGSFSGLAITNGPITITENDNDLLMVAVDGTSSGQIKLAAGSYATPAALAAEIQSKINGDSRLKEAGAAVTVAFNASTNKFEFSSNKYGSKSNVQITAVGSTTETSLGLKVAQSGTGTNVAGTINGENAKGDGQILTGTGRTEGLKLTVTGDTPGEYGTIGFSRGFASKLDQTVTGLLGGNGLLRSRVDGLKRDITNIETQGKTMTRRLEGLEKLYRAQFTALDVQIATMNSTSSYLGQQLSMLNNLASNNRK
ncbi:flagellar filament capping protein FliD [Chitinilyticum litopenaei]|uniref:flagellar filament capping protein FliD n=1 Tax=Chitinilyticum litopenaei TaxID=1121276 RepID=UPI00040E8106|nr:flagellar filament capping protein FliD [Chitinilyticum litopenaei]